MRTISFLKFKFSNQVQTFAEFLDDGDGSIFLAIFKIVPNHTATSYFMLKVIAFHPTESSFFFSSKCFQKLGEIHCT